MADKKNKKHANKKSAGRRKIFGALIFFILCFAFLGLGVYFINLNYAKIKPVVYISNENPKQGDTIFIKVTGDVNSMNGYFDQKKIVFFRIENSSDWISLLGIDAHVVPGKHIISFEFTGSQKITREINVDAANFPSTNMAGSKISQTSGLKAENIVYKDNPVLYKAMSSSNPKPYFTKPFSFPLSDMQKSGFGFGALLDYTGYDLQHLGIDLRAPMKTKIYAVNDGKVVLATKLPNYGNIIVIDHGLGLFSLYLHLDKFDVSLGQMVKQNQIIGLSGDTGYASGPHLHFSVKDNGSSVDPILFIKATSSI